MGWVRSRQENVWAGGAELSGGHERPGRWRLGPRDSGRSPQAVVTTGGKAWTALSALSAHSRCSVSTQSRQEALADALRQIKGTSSVLHANGFHQGWSLNFY